MTRPLRIAVVGGGISGLGAAWILSRKHEVTLFEAEARLGGHARTVSVNLGDGEFGVDTGFIVFNHVNYPNLCGLFAELGVATIKSDMSFAVTIDDGRIEFGCRNLATMLAQPRNAIRPAYWRMIRDISRFNRLARSVCAARPELSVAQLLDHLRLGDWFEHQFLLPMSGAIWSSPRQAMREFPAARLVRFFDHHGLLSMRGQHQWWTVEGGSRHYVRKIEERITARLETSARVTAIRSIDDQVQIRVDDTVRGFDHVILACHSDTSLALLDEPGTMERRILEALPYQRNQGYLHTDASQMPRRRACWSSWVYRGSSSGNEVRPSVTYWMNSLQRLPSRHQVFVSLNPAQAIPEHAIIDDFVFEHPQFGGASQRAQSDLDRIQGRQNIWYCGAWTGYGFHEDGLASAVKVAHRLGVTPSWSPVVQSSPPGSIMPAASR